MVTGAALGGGGDLANQVVSGEPIDWGSVGVSTLVGGVTGGAGHHLDPLIKTGAQAFVSGAVTDGAADLTTQALTGDGPINWGQVGVSALGGGAGGAADHHFSSDPPTLDTPTSHGGGDGAAAGGGGGGGGQPDTLTVYRGTGNVAELAIHGDTGLMMSDAARNGYMSSGGDVDAAIAHSQAAHDNAVNTWGSEGDYVEAHSAFGRRDLRGQRRAVDGVGHDRSGMSPRSSPARMASCMRAEVPRDSLLPQTLSRSNESEYLARNSIPMEPDGARS